MIFKFKTVRELVKHICTENPQSANNDKLLVLNFWQHQGIDIPLDVREEILTKGKEPEFITRARRLLEANGEIKVSPEARQRRTKGMNEMMNYALTEKEQEEISKQPLTYTEYQRPDGTWAMKPI